MFVYHFFPQRNLRLEYFSRQCRRHKSECVHVCVCAHVLKERNFSVETPVVNQRRALHSAWPRPSVQSQNSEMENNLHIIFGVFLSQCHSVLCTVLLRFSNLFLNSLWIWLLLLPLGYYSTI